MKDLETTWSHIVGRKLALVREERGMSIKELSEKVGHSDAYIATVLARSKKGNEEVFRKIGISLGLPQTKIDLILHESLLEAIEDEYGVGIAFALKSHFKLSDKGVRDAMKYLIDLSKNDKE